MMIKWYLGAHCSQNLDFEGVEVVVGAGKGWIGHVEDWDCCKRVFAVEIEGFRLNIYVLGVILGIWVGVWRLMLLGMELTWLG